MKFNEKFYLKMMDDGKWKFRNFEQIGDSLLQFG